MAKLGIVVGSVRENRAGGAVADWFEGVARTQAGFTVERLDLKEWDLPLLREPQHPAKRQYTDPKVTAWSAAVQACDAFAIVTPEYNFSAPPALVNALDTLYLEWNYKPAGFVSYGGLSGGMRAVQAAKLLLTTLKVVPMYEAVTLVNFSQYLQAGVLAPPEEAAAAARTMLAELGRWEGALRTLRRG